MKKKQMAGGLSVAVAAGMLLATATYAQEPAPAPPSPAPLMQAHFHHVHVNSIDPDAAIAFYTAKFKARKEKFAGLRDAVWTGEYWVLLTKVDSPPPTEIVSGIWHIGWGAEDMRATYQKQLDSGTKFVTPITDISAMTGAPPDSGRFLYAYVDGPDHIMIELNTSANHNFGHVHMFSADAPATGEWYAKHFGFKMRAQAQERVYNNVHIAPAAFVTADHVSMIIYPQQYLKDTLPELWKDRTDFAPTKGRVVDHLGFSVENLDDALRVLRADGVRVTAEPVERKANNIKFAFIEGPDHVSIELIEDHSAKPAAIAD
jgi:catechol 2,3-dioxygenase-like lactoylglutathione lyase family enzyme